MKHYWPRAQDRSSGGLSTGMSSMDRFDGLVKTLGQDRLISGTLHEPTHAGREN